MKYIFVSGGVVSGLGKGVTSASLAFLLKSRGYKVTNVKEDLGHYERFLYESLSRENYITTEQIIHIIPNQKEYLSKKQYDGTIRLGSWPCVLKKGTKFAKIYGGKTLIHERHRHRYEFNNTYKEKFEKKGKLVEAIELTNNAPPYLCFVPIFDDIIQVVSRSGQSKSGWRNGRRVSLKS